MRIRNSIVMVIATFILFSCASTSALPQEKFSSGDVAVSQANSQTTAKTASKKSSYQGEGLVIAVPSPQLTSSQSTDKWIPQFMQDSITTNLARYSKMTVIDRANEDLIIAEQELSETGYYDEENAVELGKMTNAQLVCIGTIQKTASKYSVNFRVNDIETNEIKAAFSETYLLAQIENGEAVQEISKEILLGLGIELDNKTITALSKTDDKSITSTKSLAKGYAAQENGDDIEALYQFMLAGDAGNIGQEAERNVLQILDGTVSATSIKEKYAQQQMLIEKWSRIFEQLGMWLEYNLPIFVYDFSTVKDSISNGNKKVDLTVSPGIKIVPNRNAVLLYKKILFEWIDIYNQYKKFGDEDYKWVEEVNLSKYLPINHYYEELDFSYVCDVGLFDMIGERFTEPLSIKLQTRLLCVRSINFNKSLDRIPSMQEYFDKAKLQEPHFTVSLQYMPDEFDVKFCSVKRAMLPRNGSYWAAKNSALEKFNKATRFNILSVEEFKALYGVR